AQLLEQPADLRIGTARPMQRLELVDRAHAIAVGRGGVRQPVEAPRGRTEVADDVVEPRNTGRRYEPGVHEPPQLALHVAPCLLEGVAGRRAETRPPPPHRAEPLATWSTPALHRGPESARRPRPQRLEPSLVPSGPAEPRHEPVDGRRQRIGHDRVERTMRRT